MEINKHNITKIARESAKEILQDWITTHSVVVCGVTKCIHNCILKGKFECGMKMVFIDSDGKCIKYQESPKDERGE